MPRCKRYAYIGRLDLYISVAVLEGFFFLIFKELFRLNDRSKSSSVFFKDEKERLKYLKEQR